MAGIVDVAKKAAELVKKNQTGGVASWSSGGSSGNQTVSPPANTGGSSPDYSVMINQAIKDGASADYVQSLVDKRSEKIAGDSSLAKYSGDSVFQNAYDYINSQKAKNQAYSANQIYTNAMSQYQAAQKAQQQAIQASVDRSVNALKKRIPEIEKQTAEANTGAYNSYLRAVDPFGVNGQKEAYMGINDTGYSETNRARLGTAYQGAVNTNEAQKIALIEDIYAQIEDAKLSGDIEKANALAAYAQQVAGMQITQGNALLENSLAEYENKQAAEQYDRQLALQKAETLAAYGDFSGYAALGYSDTQIANMKAAYQAQQALALTKTTGSSGGGNKNASSYDPILTYNQVMTAIKEGNITNQVLKDYEYYNGEAYVDPSVEIATLTGDEEFSSARASQYLFEAYAKELDEGRKRYGSYERVQKLVDEMAAEGISDRDIALFLVKLGWTPDKIYG